MKIEILYEDSYIFVVIKPPGIPSQPDKTGDQDMTELLMEQRKQKEGILNPYLGIVHRLDRPVGGIMVYAKTKEANASLSAQIRLNQIEKMYDAVLCGSGLKEEGELRHFLLKRSKDNRSIVVEKGTGNAKEAILNYKKIACIASPEEGDLTLVRVHLKTGRHHQIRVQFSDLGFPLWGDRKYHPSFQNKKIAGQIALWSGRLSFLHPKTNKKMDFEKQSEEYPFLLFQEKENFLK